MTEVLQDGYNSETEEGRLEQEILLKGKQRQHDKGHGFFVLKPAVCQAAVAERRAALLAVSLTYQDEEIFVEMAAPGNLQDLPSKLRVM